VQQEFNAKLAELLATHRPFALATVIRVRGSTSAKPGSKALIDEAGRNVFGWVGGGCAESLVREQALTALQDHATRIVTADLDDEVLGVGMPCGGEMDVYIEPVFPKPKLLIAGQNKLARSLALVAGHLGYAVTVHGPEADPAHFPTAERVVRQAYDGLAVASHEALVVATQHQGDLESLRAGLVGAVPYLALVARREVAERVFQQLHREGFAEESFARVRIPAGLDLGGKTPEAVSLSIAAELLASARDKSARPLRDVKGLLPSPAQPSPLETTQPELLIVGHGRIAEELARLGTLMGWPVTVNSPGAQGDAYPSAACLVTSDLDYSAMTVTPSTFVVICTQHKGDHLSLHKSLEGRPAYIGLVASQKRSGLVLDYLRERGEAPAALGCIHAPAGLDLGAISPAEIALSVMSEMVMRQNGRSARPLQSLKTVPRSGDKSCQGQFD
jgi:xanthine dehydrogenase accessory factor